MRNLLAPQAVAGRLLWSQDLLRGPRTLAIYSPPPGQNFEGVWVDPGDLFGRQDRGTVELPPMTSAAATRYAAACSGPAQG